MNRLFSLERWRGGGDRKGDRGERPGGGGGDEGREIGDDRVGGEREGMETGRETDRQTETERQTERDRERDACTRHRGSWQQQCDDTCQLNCLHNADIWCRDRRLLKVTL